MKNIQNKHTFAVLGGDLRQSTVARKLIESGGKVKIFGLNCGGSIVGAEICMTVERAVSGCDVIILPLPASRDNVNLSVSDRSYPAVPLCDIVKLAEKYDVKTILGGMLPEETVNTCRKLGIIAYDYYKNETLQEKNALPSAEGALMVAMENTDITVFGMRALVCGYGRIGKRLASILKKLGACVSVAARRDEVLCEIAMSGYDAVRIDSNFPNNDEYDVIFNTVPYVIFHEKAISKICGTPLYIEIASKPGGIDIASARNRSIRVINAPSLPGKYSPLSAGEYIFETISEMLAEGGEES